MTYTSESGSRYLALALSARRVMASLRPVSAGEALNPDLGDSLAHFISGVQSGGGVSYLNRLQDAGENLSYEEVTTFSDVTGRFGADKILRAFRAVTEKSNDAPRDKEAKELISFFGAIERQALDEYASAMQARMA